MAENVQDALFSLEERDREEAQRVVQNHGVENIVNHMLARLNQTENVTINIAVAGAAGSGKSTFINTIRGIRPGDEGGAAVGFGQTSVPTPYIFPTNANVTIWDLPGVGTEEFRREHYVRRVQLDYYDFVLIFTMKRITDNDLWLAREVKRNKKGFYLVPTHIDCDVHSVQETHPGLEDSDILAQIRENANRRLLEKQIVIHQRGQPGIVYLISTLLRDTAKWDFEKLVKDMTDSLDDTRRQVLSLALSNLSVDLIEKKCDVLRARIWQVACICGGAGAVPIPIADVMFCGGLLVRTVTDYKTQLGLNDASLVRLSQRTGVPYKTLVSTANQYLKISVSASASAVIRHNIAAGAAKSVLSAGSRWIPILGSVIGASLNFGTAYSMLHSILSDMEKAATHVVTTALKSRRT